MEKGKKEIRILVEKFMKVTLTGKKSQPSFSKKTTFEGASKWTRNSPKRNMSWTCRAIYLFLKSRNIILSQDYIYKFCKRMRISSKFAARKNPHECKEEIDNYENVVYPDLCHKAIEENAIILHIDETHILIHPRKKGYSCVNTPSMFSYDGSLGHSNYSVVTFMGFDGYIRCFVIKYGCNSEKFTDCLKEIKKEFKGRKIFLVMDNAPIHTSYETMGWLADNKRTFTVHFLPRYCPRMNVVEYFNNSFKKQLKDKTTISTKELIMNALTIVDKYNSKTDEIKEEIKSYYLKSECSFAKKHMKNARKN